MLAIRCSWFALCDRAADGLRDHRVLGAVPICERCAERVEQPVTDEERAALRAELDDLRRAELRT